MKERNKNIDIINKGVKYIDSLMNGTHNYEKIINYIPKLFKVNSNINKKISDHIISRANAINIQAEGMKELEHAPLAILTQKIKQNEAVIKWLEKYQTTEQKAAKGTTPNLTNTSWWKLIDARIVELAFDKFNQGYFADAVLTCLRELNSILKKHAIANGRKERDGSNLINNTFSISDPLIQLADLKSESGRNIQVGYMKIFEGMMIGIRNPKSHENMYPDEETSIHLIFFASFMMKKLRENGVALK
jgi:uncharacterized protein (TIGR02391 family)